MKRVAVNSSSLRALGYDPDEQTLEVEFHNGSLYRYEQVPADVVQALLEADSLGRYFNQVFKAQQYPFGVSINLRCVLPLGLRVEADREQARSYRRTKPTAGGLQSRRVGFSPPTWAERPGGLKPTLRLYVDQHG